jgi:hypothetical protein
MGSNFSIISFEWGAIRKNTVYFFQRDSSNLMGLISTRDITELAQIATEIAAQTMQGNGELLSVTIFCWKFTLSIFYFYSIF